MNKTKWVIIGAVAAVLAFLPGLRAQQGQAEKQQQVNRSSNNSRRIRNPIQT